MSTADGGTAGPPHGDDGYDGPAELVSDDRTIPVQVTLRGHFDPISGHYSWYGRVAADPQIPELLARGRRIRLRTPLAEVDTSLGDIDPWGRARVAGFGAAPFTVLDTVEAVQAAVEHEPPPAG